MSNVVIGELKKNENNVIRVTLNRFKNKDYLHIRAYYLNDEE